MSDVTRPEEEAVLPESDVELVERPGRNLLKGVVRLVVGLGVFGLLIALTPDRQKLVDTLREADFAWVASGAGLLLLALLVSSFRWRAYLEALELRMPVGTVIRLYYVGTFFNAFLPSGVGGDAYKAIRIGKGRKLLTQAFASVFLDRFAGFVALGLVGLIGVAIELLTSDHDPRVAQISLVLSLGMLGAAALLMLVGERMLGRGRLVKAHGIGGKVRGAVRAIHEAGRHPEAAFRGYMFGLLFVVLVVAYHLCVGRALGITQISVPAMAGVVVVASLATMIPLSVGGVGFREGAYIWALGTFGIARETATAFALLVLAILLLTSAVGGVVYLVRGGDVPDRALTRA